MSVAWLRAWVRRLAWQDVARLVALGVVVVEVAFVLMHSKGGDAHAYWAAQFPDPYADSAVNQRDAYLYSPAFLHALTPLRWLPAAAFQVVWTVGLAGIVLWLLGPIIAAAFLVPTAFSPVFTELWYGNVTFLLALVAIRGIRAPAWWALGILTKVTPGICLLWFLVRREWRNLSIALGATVAIGLLSFALAPEAWFSWLRLLGASFGSEGVAQAPNLAIRLGLSAALVAIGAIRSETRVIPIAMIIAMPVVWYASFSLLAVWIYELRHGARRDMHGSASDVEEAGNPQ